jgi:hypothetical protein
LLFAEDLKIFRVIKSAEDCKLLKTDIDSVQKWCIENCMKINLFHALKLFIDLIRSKFEYASVVGNNLTLADSNKLENIK